jgi:hypothetical protein
MMKTEDSFLVGFGTVWSGRSLSAFWASLLPPSIWYKIGETLITVYQTTRCHIPQDSNRLHQHCMKREQSDQHCEHLNL